MAQDPKTDSRNSIFQDFFHSEVSGSIVLLACTVLALAWANSPWAASYFEIQHAKIGLSFGEAKFALSLQHWINDGLMVIFFFVVGLEIKRELVAGELSSMRNAALPVAAAIGGMVIPALVFTSFNLGGAGANGWGIPMATDIAFALGILALFGSRAPLGLKVFLTALAIADDLGAVMVIAIFYTDSIEWAGLIVAAVLMGLLLLARWSGTRKVGVYLVLAIGGLARGAGLGGPRDDRRNPGRVDRAGTRSNRAQSVPGAGAGAPGRAPGEWTDEDEHDRRPETARCDRGVV